MNPTFKRVVLAGAATVALAACESGSEERHSVPLRSPPKCPVHHVFQSREFGSSYPTRWNLSQTIRAAPVSKLGDRTR